MLIDIGADTTEAHQFLERIADRLDDRSGILELLGDLLVEYETDVFATSGHGAWAPLDPATIAAKGSTRILVNTGDLMRELTGSGADRPEGESVVVTGTEYAGYLKAGARGAPPRDPAPEPPHSDVEHWAHELLGHLTGVLR